MLSEKSLEYVKHNINLLYKDLENIKYVGLYLEENYSENFINQHLFNTYNSMKDSIGKLYAIYKNEKGETDAI